MDAVDVHGGNDPRVVNLNSHDLMLHYERAPLIKDVWMIGENTQETICKPQVTVGMGNSFPKSVGV